LATPRHEYKLTTPRHEYKLTTPRHEYKLTTISSLSVTSIFIFIIF